MIVVAYYVSPNHSYSILININIVIPFLFLLQIKFVLRLQTFVAICIVTHIPGGYTDALGHRKADFGVLVTQILGCGHG